MIGYNIINANFANIVNEIKNAINNRIIDTMDPKTEKIKVKAIKNIKGNNLLSPCPLNIRKLYLNASSILISLEKYDISKYVKKNVYVNNEITNNKDIIAISEYDGISDKLRTNIIIIIINASNDPKYKNILPKTFLFLILFFSSIISIIFFINNLKIKKYIGNVM